MMNAHWAAVQDVAAAEAEALDSFEALMPDQRDVLLNALLSGAPRHCHWRLEWLRLSSPSELSPFSNRGRADSAGVGCQRGPGGRLADD